MQREISGTIYERVKYGATWRRQRVVTPPLKANGTLYLKDDRHGVLQFSWYEDRVKRWQKVKDRVSDGELPFFSDAIAQAREKSWFLSNRHHDVSDPTSRRSVAESAMWPLLVVSRLPVSNFPKCIEQVREPNDVRALLLHPIRESARDSANYSQESLVQRSCRPSQHLEILPNRR
jgi:hypothetical protein